MIDPKNHTDNLS